MTSDKGRFFCAVFLVGTSGLTAASCGSSGDATSTFPMAGKDASMVEDAPSVEVGSIIGEGGTVCVPKTCTDLGFTCGKNGNGCGDVLDCGSGNAAPSRPGRGGLASWAPPGPRAGGPRARSTSEVTRPPHLTP